MTWLFTYIPLLLLVAPQDVMEAFHKLNSQQQELKFIDRYSGKRHPSIQAYVLGVQLKQAEYSLSPLKKIRIYNRYKGKLNDLVLAHPKNVHIRYVRLLVQQRVPKMFQCKDLIQQDKLFLRTYLSRHATAPTPFIKYIKSNTAL